MDRINDPDQLTIAQFKAQFADRALALIEAEDGDTVYCFVMTGPTRDEYDKFAKEMLEASAIKNDYERVLAIRSVVERSAFAQIRHPERAEVKRIFDSRPAMIVEFSEHIRNLAGDSITVRAKKL